ncbi:MAG: hypothetical protein AB7O81_00060 [Blastocatellales bacterium]
MTISGVLAEDNQPDDLTDDQRDQIEKAAMDIMQEEFAAEPQFAATLRSIGWSVAPRPDGVVVAKIDGASRRHIEKLGARLQEKLKPRLAEIHPALKPKPASGAKYTTGFFNEQKDFRIDHNLAQALEELRSVEAEILIERVALVRFRKKSLEDAEIIHEIKLSQPADPPIRKTIAKPKLFVAPRWPRWCGFSYLWDHPDESVLAHHANTGLLQVACEPWTDSKLGLYRALGDALAEVGLDSAINPFSFCPLPSTSYHVTTWDGINEENLSLLAESEREEFARFLLGLPESARRTPPSLIPPNAFADLLGSAPMQFKFDGLAIWGDATLVARLAPVDEPSARLLEQVKERRAQLDYRFASMGRLPSPDYAPHVTLGYFYHPEGARAAIGDLNKWEQTFLQRAAEQRIAFGSISAYGFTSMDTFLKLEFA